ncbi:NarK/NasA family nitrate transporter [Paracoccus sp. DMF-8]|uniref:MFS transporter n=1 Tax=Paracoccus sp. DMF-8 TaxID=3019445 RepID=UPI0023E89C90|nr:NarK/NasA family nitrate transporter [Paracoccus sp. DMF-8]MDF3607063.1 NarK/NasA family nitrate transporter [Paracoccus sp. DMF-8]
MSAHIANPSSSGRALALATTAFTVCFAIWTIFSIIGIQLRQEYGLSESQFGLLLGLPILTGSLSRIFLGQWADRFGGRPVYTLTMLVGAVSTILLSFAGSYHQLLLGALGVGIAGGSSAVGVAYVSRFYTRERQGFALGIFGMGNVGAALTKFIAPFLVIAFGWQVTAQIWGVLLVVTAILFWILSEDDPVTRARRDGSANAPVASSSREVLREARVWRFALYYFFAFGGFVALALWLPTYLTGFYGMDLKTAGLIAAAYSVPGSIFRAWGGSLSDRFTARRVMAGCLWVSLAALLVLLVPHPGNVTLFIVALFVLGVAMSFGKAAVYRYIPDFYPSDVGIVGGFVGMIGGIGGFVLPLLFGYLLEVTGSWTSCFAALLVVVLLSIGWMARVLAGLRGPAEPRHA